MAATSELHSQHPVEYPAGTPPLDEEEASRLHAQVDPAWRRDGTRRIWREFRFRDFRDAFGFATRVALLVEREAHHPELTVAWGSVVVTTWTHTANGLSPNDFIIAAKIDRLVPTAPAAGPAGDDPGAVHEPR